MLHLDMAIAEHILKLSSEQEQAGWSLSVGSVFLSWLWSVKRIFEDSEERALAKLGITYGVLRRLGFSEIRVQECLHSISSYDLEDAYEWLYIHCEEMELIARGNHIRRNAKDLVNFIMRQI